VVDAVVVAVSIAEPALPGPDLWAEPVEFDAGFFDGLANGCSFE
jgi:hypothetical protein